MSKEMFSYIRFYSLNIPGPHEDDLLTQASNIIIIYLPKPFKFEQVSWQTDWLWNFHSVTCLIYTIFNAYVLSTY